MCKTDVANLPLEDMSAQFKYTSFVRLEQRAAVDGLKSAHVDVITKYQTHCLNFCYPGIQRLSSLTS